MASSKYPYYLFLRLCTVIVRYLIDSKGLWGRGGDILFLIAIALGEAEFHLRKVAKAARLHRRPHPPSPARRRLRPAHRGRAALLQARSEVARLVHRRVAQGRQALPPDHSCRVRPAYLLQVADELFAGEILDEKNFAVMLLEGMTGNSAATSSSFSKAGSTASLPGPTTTPLCTT